MASTITALLTLLLLVALIIPRRLPLIKDVRYPRIAAIALWLLTTFMVGAVLPRQSDQEAPNVATVNISSPKASGEIKSAPSEVEQKKFKSKPDGKWIHFSETDKLRGTTLEGYFVKSLENPKISLAMVSDRTTEMPTILNNGIGKIECTNKLMGACMINIRFGDNPHQAIQVLGDNNMMLLVSKDMNVTNAVKGSEFVVVEVMIYGKAKQYTFPTNGY